MANILCTDGASANLPNAPGPISHLYICIHFHPFWKKDITGDMIVIQRESGVCKFLGSQALIQQRA